MGKKRAITTIGKKKPAIISLWLGAQPHIASIPELRTRNHWVKWASTAFALPKDAEEMGMIWKATAKADRTHYLVTVRLVKG